MEFKVGDIVRIKDWDVMKKQFGLIDDSINCKCGFVSGMKSLCGKKAFITGIDDYEITLDFIDYAPDEDWSFSTDMIEHVDEDYIKLFIGAKGSIGDPTGDELFKCPTGEPGEPIKIIFDKNGGIEMKNEVLELWYERVKDFIETEYAKQLREYVSDNEVVKEYNKITKEALEKLALLYDDCKETGFIMKIAGDYRYIDTHYVINDEAIETLFDEINYDNKIEKLAKLESMYKEIKALLSLSTDLAYQQDILIQYGIIDKKTKKMVDIDEDSIN